MNSNTSSYGPPKPRRLRWIVSIIVLALVFGAGGFWAMKNKKSTAVAEAKPADKPLVMELAANDVATVVSRELRASLSLSGTLMPLNQTTVKSKVAAEVREILVQEGNKISKGQIIARLDVADLRARLASQQASVDEVRARVSLAEKNRETNLALLKQNFISQNAFDSIASNVDVSQASLRAAQAQLEIAKRAMDDAVVRAPMDGIVSKRFVQPGEKINFDSPIATLVDLARLELEAPVPASEIPRVKIGQEVAFNVDGFNGRNFIGEVERINPAAESGSRSIIVYVAVNNTDNALKGGMFAKGNITIDKTAAVPLVPLSALRQEKDHIVVHQIVDGKIVAQPVTLGLRNEDEGVAEIKSGLAEGAQIIAVKLDSVKVGTAVTTAKTAMDAETKPAAMKN